MTRIAILAVVVAVVACGLPDGGLAYAKAPKRCTPSPTKTVVRTSAAVRVLELQSGKTRVCSRTTWKSRVLDPDPSSQHSIIEDIRDRYVADQLFTTDRDGGFRVKVRVLDAARGRFVITRQAFTGSCCVYPATTHSTEGVRSAALGSDGSLAWISSRLHGDPELEVRYAAAGRKTDLLDVDASIDPTSIAVGSRDVYWRHADGARSWAIPAE
jgi:hypothetical protein